MCLLRTAPCTGSPELPKFDAALSESMSTTLNIDLGNDSWTQVSLPVRFGGLGICSVVSLAPSAYTWHQPRALRSSLRLCYLLDCMMSSTVVSQQPCLHGPSWQPVNQTIYHVYHSFSTCLTSSTNLGQSMLSCSDRSTT